MQRTDGINIQPRGLHNIEALKRDWLPRRDWLRLLEWRLKRQAVPWKCLKLLSMISRRIIFKRLFRRCQNEWWFFRITRFDMWVGKDRLITIWTKLRIGWCGIRKVRCKVDQISFWYHFVTHLSFVMCVTDFLRFTLRDCCDLFATNENVFVKW